MEIISKSFRCVDLYQIIIDKAKKYYKLNSDTDVILYALMLLRNDMGFSLKVPEDDKYNFVGVNMKDETLSFEKVDLDDPEARRWLKKWREDNLPG